MKPAYLGLVLLNTLILVSGQFLWKHAVEGRAADFAALGSIIRLFVSPCVLAGIFLYAVATVLWLFILSRVALSLAYPIQSLAYAIAVVGAYYLFGEPLDAAKIAGSVLIVLGISLIAGLPRVS